MYKPRDLEEAISFVLEYLQYVPSEDRKIIDELIYTLIAVKMSGTSTYGDTGVTRQDFSTIFNYGGYGYSYYWNGNKQSIRNLKMLTKAISLPIIDYPTETSLLLLPRFLVSQKVTTSMYNVTSKNCLFYLSGMLNFADELYKTLNTSGEIATELINNNIKEKLNICLSTVIERIGEIFEDYDIFDQFFDIQNKIEEYKVANRNTYIADYLKVSIIRRLASIIPSTVNISKYKHLSVLIAPYRFVG